jgi:2'-5' RNA ligase
VYRPKLFTGIDLDRRTRESCAEISGRLQAQGLPAKFEPAQKLHVTLAFLGWVEPERVEAIEGVLRSVAFEFKPFTLTLDRVGAFPHERRPRVVWIGSRQQGEAFRALAHNLRDAYARIGFTFDKDAVAHVTIARIKGGHSHLPLLDIKPMRLRVRKLTLFESLPDGKTTRYEPRAYAALQGGGERGSE